MKNDTQETAETQALAQTQPNVAGKAIERIDNAMQPSGDSVMAALEMGIMAEIQSSLKSLVIDKLTAASTLLDRPLNVHDAILMTFEGFKKEGKDNGERVVFEVSDADGVVYNVAQGAIGSRMTVVKIFDNIRKLQKNLTLTNCYFKEVGKPVGGNTPIILFPSNETQYLWG